MHATAAWGMEFGFGEIADGSPVLKKMLRYQEQCVMNL